MLQATGDHPAPCARFCEATAFNIELRRREREIEKLRAENAALLRVAEVAEKFIDELDILVLEQAIRAWKEQK